MNRLLNTGCTCDIDLKHTLQIIFKICLIVTILTFLIPKAESFQHNQSATNWEYQADTTIFVDVRPTHYLFRINFAEEESGHYTAYTEITVENMADIATTTFELDAANALINVISVTSMTSWTAYEFTQSDDLLTVNLPLESGETESFRISYELTPGTINGPFGAMGLWFNGTSGWTFSFPDGAHAWSPIIDNVAIKVPVTWELGVNEGLTSVANGYLDSTWTDGYNVNWFRWVEEDPVCTSEMGLCVDDYVVIEAQTDPFSIRYYVYPEDSAAAVYDFGRVPEAIGIYEEAFGYDYPLCELKQVECGVFGGSGGQEHQTMVSLGFNMITGNRQYEDIIIHEVAHMWFADMLTPANWDHFWLSEGFAVYSEALFREQVEGWDGYLDNIRSDRSSYISFLNGGGTQALVNSDYYTTMNSALPYQRGGLALHQLRSRYGMETFTNAVSRYCEENALGLVVSETLRDCFIEETNDSTLYQWFDEWIYRGEIPFFIYALSQDGDRLYVMQEMNSSNSPSHGELYESMRIYYGYASPDTNDVLKGDWPTGQNWMMIEGLNDLEPVPGESPALFPNYEVPMRSHFLNHVNSPELSARFKFTDEGANPDRVIQMNENVELQFLIENAGLPMVNPTWTIDCDDYNLIWNETEGELETIDFIQEETPAFSVNVRSRGIFSEHYSSFTLAIADENYDTTFTMMVSMGHPEILMVTDGIDNIDNLEMIYGPIFEELNYTWGTAGVEINQLPEDMYEATTIFIEADGSHSEFLFTEADSTLRNWFVNGGNGCISGTEMHQAYLTADETWEDVLFGRYDTWLMPFENVFVGTDADIIFNQRFITTSGESLSGNTALTAINSPSICYTPGGFCGGGKRERGDTRMVNYGFPLTHVKNDGYGTMYRDELIERTTIWVMGQEPSDIEYPPEDLLPSSLTLSTYPNPFNSELNISVNLPSSSQVRISVTNILGQQVALLADKEYEAGLSRIVWNSDNLRSGTYIIKVESPEEVIAHKVLLIK